MKAVLTLQKDFKWLYIVSFLGMFAVLPLGLLVGYSSMRILLFFIIFLAIALAYVQFSYLHHDEKIRERTCENTLVNDDVNVTRTDNVDELTNDIGRKKLNTKQIFSHIVISSFLIYWIPFFVNLGLTVVVALVQSFYYEGLVLDYLNSISMYFVFFVLVYFVVVIAICVTSSFGFSVLYFIFLCFLESLISSSGLYQLIYQHLTIGMMFLIGVAVFLGFLAYTVYINRPDEYEEKAIIYPLAEKITKYVIVIPFSFYVSAFLIGMLGTSVAVAQIGCILISCWVLNFIVNCAFITTWQNALKDWKDFAVTGVISVVIYMIFFA